MTSSYAVFAQYYDDLTQNVEYVKWADYLLELLKRLGHQPGLTVDLACGTGTLTLELFRRGVDIYGVDASVEMLSEAKVKCAEAGADILFLRQKLQALDLYGTVNTALCTLDSLNHLHSREEVQKAFDKVSLFMDPGGWFLFDMNTPYKHEKVLGDNIFVYDIDDVYCVWQNHYSSRDHRVDIQLDFFQRENEMYFRSSESFFELDYSTEEIMEMLKKSGFGQFSFFEALTFDPPSSETQRIIYAAQKISETQIGTNRYGR